MTRYYNKMLGFVFVLCALLSSVIAEPSISQVKDVGKVLPVKIKVLEEALCPGCKEFVLEVLIPAYNKLGATVMDVQVVPFGNAEYVPDKHNAKKKTLECQHGVAECDANSYEQCVALALYPYPQRYLPFLQCLYNTLPIGSSSEKISPKYFANCAKKSALDWKTIAACHGDKQQAEMLQQVAFALTPEHDYVPWVEVDGKHIEIESDEDFLIAVCQAYKAHGGSNPECEQMIQGSVRKEKKLKRCYV